MKHKYAFLIALALSTMSFTCQATELNDNINTENHVDTQINMIENPPVERLSPTFDKNIAFDAFAGSTYRFEVFFDRTIPDIYFCLQNETELKYQAKDLEADVDGTKIEVRTVETIPGQNFSVIYFTPGVEGTYTIEYSSTETTTFILAQTDLRDDYETNLRETRLPVTKTFYNIVGPYTEVPIETLLDVNYDPYANNANELIHEKVVDDNIYIPINPFTISAVFIFFLIIAIYFGRKILNQKSLYEENINRNDLLDTISKSKIADEEQNEALKNYWNIIKNDYVDI